MKIAVVQHRLRGTAEEDAAALVETVRRASDSGAQLAFLPDIPTLSGDAISTREALLGALADVACARLLPPVASGSAEFSGEVSPSSEIASLGKVALLVGDACLDTDVYRTLLGARPSVVMLCPRSESDLQAEAVLEVAIGLSSSLAGLVVIAECSGAEPGEPGHGGSAAVFLGEVVTEAMADDDLLIADVLLPIPQPEPAEALPQVPPILEQRIAHHRGRKARVDYPADLS